MTAQASQVLIRPGDTVEAESLRRTLRPPCNVVAVEESDSSATALVMALPRRLPSASDLAAMVRRCDLPIVMLVDVVDPWAVALSRWLGRPTTLVSWRSPVQEVVCAIQGCERVGKTRPSTVDALDTLSARERDVIVLLAEGRRDADIASCLGISIHTVRSHVRSALVKLDAPHRHAAAAAVRAGRLLRRSEPPTARWHLDEIPGA
jgi:DNA-binding CsgD family transcriptional regulator